MEVCGQKETWTRSLSSILVSMNSLSSCNLRIYTIIRHFPTKHSCLVNLHSNTYARVNWRHTTRDGSRNQSKMTRHCDSVMGRTRFVSIQDPYLLHFREARCHSIFHSTTTHTLFWQSLIPISPRPSVQVPNW